MGGLVLPLIVLLVICLLLFLSSFLGGSGQQSNGGHGKGGNGRGHGNGKGGQPDDPADPQGKGGAGKGKGSSGRKASGGQPGQPGRGGRSQPRGGSAHAFVPPPVLPAFNTPQDRERYCRDLESQGCTVDRRSGTVTRPGEAPQSTFMNTLVLLGALGGSLLLFIRIYGSPIAVILEFIRIMSER